MVSEAFLKAWRAYENHAWGHDELLPVTNSSMNWLGIIYSILIIPNLSWHISLLSFH
jgi:hypothetical protein